MRFPKSLVGLCVLAGVIVAMAVATATAFAAGGKGGNFVFNVYSDECGVTTLDVGCLVTVTQKTSAPGKQNTIV